MKVFLSLLVLLLISCTTPTTQSPDYDGLILTNEQDGVSYRAQYVPETRTYVLVHGTKVDGDSTSVYYVFKTKK